MDSKVWLKRTSQPLEYKDLVNAYEKGSFYCMYDGKRITKHPINDIWKVDESWI